MAISSALEERIKGWLPSVEHRIKEEIKRYQDKNYAKPPSSTSTRDTDKLTDMFREVFRFVEKRIDFDHKQSEENETAVDFGVLADKLNTAFKDKNLKQKMLSALEEQITAEWVNRLDTAERKGGSSRNRNNAVHNLAQKRIVECLAGSCKEVIQICANIAKEFVTDLITVAFVSCFRRANWLCLVCLAFNLAEHANMLKPR